MNLAALAQFVSSKVRHTDSASLALCKGYLTARFQMIWDMALWRESLVLVTATLDPTNATANNGLDAIGVWLLPAIANKIVALRDHDRSYNVSTPEEYFRCDLDEFGVTGSAVQFYLLPSCVFAFGSPVTLSVFATSPADSGNFTARILDSTMAATEVSSTIPVNSGVRGIAQLVTELSTFTKDVTANSIQIATGGAPTTIGTFSGDLTVLPQRCRLQLVEIPTTAVNLRALVKRTIPPFVNDADVPQLRNIENVLIAFAQADMLQQTRQYQKAQLLQQEGNALLLEYKKEEVYQQAATPRIIPNAESPQGQLASGGFQWKGYW